MEAFFDTSALVPVFYGDHEHHGASLQRFVQFHPGSGYCGAHSLVEVYSTLTRMPGRHRVSGDQALLFLDSVRERLEVVALSPDEYTAALHTAAELGITGGGVYDAMLAQCALKAQAATLYTWNLRHYALCGEEVVRRLRTP